MWGHRDHPTSQQMEVRNSGSRYLPKGTQPVNSRARIQTGPVLVLVSRPETTPGRNFQLKQKLLSLVFKASHLSSYPLQKLACTLSRFSHVQLCATLWTGAHGAPQVLQAEHWGGLPCPPPGDLPDPEAELASPLRPALAGRFSTAKEMELASPLHPALAGRFSTAKEVELASPLPPALAGRFSTASATWEALAEA